MGKATRWLKALLRMKKDKEKEGDSVDTSISNEKKERKRWSFGKSGRENNGVLPQIPLNLSGNKKDVTWLRSYFADTEREQNKHAIAVAAATAAAADAAVAAAQAAVAVVRLTSHGRGILFAGGRERWAAVKIQTVFRGFLARKALRALKGLVKLQALVKGYLVRKRATATLHSMQALMRAQTAVRSQRARRSLKKERRFTEHQPTKSIERFDDIRSEIHGKRLSVSYEMSAFDDSPKIVEIDTYKPRSRSHRINAALSECGDEVPYHSISSPLPFPIPAGISLPDLKNHQDFDWHFTGDECRFSTAQSTPRFANSVLSNASATPAKSFCGDTYFMPPYSNFPSYMANTQSFKAKLRSHSAPKQRPDPGPKKKLSLNEIMASRNSISGIRMQRSCSQIDEDIVV